MGYGIIIGEKNKTSLIAETELKNSIKTYAEYKYYLIVKTYSKLE